MINHKTWCFKSIWCPHTSGQVVYFCISHLSFEWKHFNRDQSLNVGVMVDESICCWFNISAIPSITQFNMFNLFNIFHVFNMFNVFNLFNMFHVFGNWWEAGDNNQPLNKTPSEIESTNKKYLHIHDGELTFIFDMNESHL